MEDKTLYFMRKLIDEDINGFDNKKFESQGGTFPDACIVTCLTQY